MTRHVVFLTVRDFMIIVGFIILLSALEVFLRRCAI